MKKTQKLIAAALAAASLCGCMSKLEYQLRSKDLKAKAAYPATYSPLVIKGPLTLDAQSELVISVPTQPYQHAPIPDGQAYQLRAIDHAILGAAAVAGGYWIKSAKGTSKTTINNYNAAEGGAQ